MRPMDATLGGYPWLPRMIDKARARLAGTLGDMVHPCPVDRMCLARLGIGFAAFTELIRATETDAEVLAGLRALGAATPAEAWFDPVRLEEELQRGIREATPASSRACPF
jgi:Domain of unknown function (DUF5069)